MLKQFQDEMLHWKTLAKKHLMFLWFKSGDFNISDIFYKNPKPKLIAIFAVITHRTYARGVDYSKLSWDRAFFNVVRYK